MKVWRHSQDTNRQMSAAAQDRFEVFLETKVDIVSNLDENTFQIVPDLDHKDDIAHIGRAVVEHAFMHNDVFYDVGDTVQINLETLQLANLDT